MLWVTRAVGRANSICGHVGGLAQEERGERPVTGWTCGGGGGVRSVTGDQQMDRRGWGRLAAS